MTLVVYAFRFPLGGVCAQAIVISVVVELQLVYQCYDIEAHKKVMFLSV